MVFEDSMVADKVVSAQHTIDRREVRTPMATVTPQLEMKIQLIVSKLLWSTLCLLMDSTIDDPSMKDTWLRGQVSGICMYTVGLNVFSGQHRGKSLARALACVICVTEHWDPYLCPSCMLEGTI